LDEPLPAVAVAATLTCMTLGPIGVLFFVGIPLPQPTILTATQARAMSMSMPRFAIVDLRRRLKSRVANAMPGIEKIVERKVDERFVLTLACGAVVDISRETVCTASLPVNTKDGGVNVQVANAGKPLQENVAAP